MREAPGARRACREPSGHAGRARRRIRAGPPRCVAMWKAGAGHVGRAGSPAGRVTRVTASGGFAWPRRRLSWCFSCRA